MARKQSVTLILKNPLNMLYDRLFQLLQVESYKDGVYALIDAIFTDEIDPTDQVKKILFVSKDCNYVWQHYQDNPDKIEGLDVNSVIKLHTALVLSLLIKDRYQCIRP